MRSNVGRKIIGSLGGVTMNLRKLLITASLLCTVVFSAATRSLAQVNTVNLSGTVLDPQNLAVKDAKITLRNPAKGIERTAASNAEGRYEFVGLPPGTYTLTVEAPGFAILTDTSFTLTLGLVAEYNPQLQVQTTAASVNVSAAPDLVETSKTDVSMTVSQNQIDNLPINGRNYINFTLLDSRAARDNTPSIGAAPNTGLNLGGQRGRSNEISVDGADAIDSSVNGVRATVSQEGVQEFQVISSSYMPEYGRAMGGVVNIVTKSGSNDFHGNAFGFLRNGAIQAQNPFSVTASCDPTTDQCGTTPVKQSYTRVQAGLTLGGPIQKDKTFFLLQLRAHAPRGNRIHGDRPGQFRADQFDNSAAIFGALPAACVSGDARATSVRSSRARAGGNSLSLRRGGELVHGDFRQHAVLPGRHISEHRRAAACFVHRLGIHHRKFSHLRKGQHLFAAPRPHLECTQYHLRAWHDFAR